MNEPFRSGDGGYSLPTHVGRAIDEASLYVGSGAKPRWSASLVATAGSQGDAELIESLVVLIGQTNGEALREVGAGAIADDDVRISRPPGKSMNRDGGDARKLGDDFLVGWLEKILRVVRHIRDWIRRLRTSTDARRAVAGARLPVRTPMRSGDQQSDGIQFQKHGDALRSCVQITAGMRRVNAERSTGGGIIDVGPQSTRIVSFAEHIIGFVLLTVSVLDHIVSQRIRQRDRQMIVFREQCAHGLTPGGDVSVAGNDKGFGIGSGEREGIQERGQITGHRDERS